MGENGKNEPKQQKKSEKRQQKPKNKNKKHTHTWRRKRAERGTGRGNGGPLLEGSSGLTHYFVGRGDFLSLSVTFTIRKLEEDSYFA